MKEIPLSKGKVALVDDDVYDELVKHEWRARKMCGDHWYATRSRYESGKTYMIYMHREIMHTPKGMDTDHIDGQTLHNCRANLRICTRTQNLQNRKNDRRNTTGYRCVTFTPGAKLPYRATITIKRKQHTIGTFATAEEAAKAYNEVAFKLHGEYARLNKLREAV